MNRQFTLSCLRKFWPVAGDWGIQIQFSLIDEPMGAQSRDALTCRIDIDDRVAGPWRLRVSAREPSPQVHDHSLIDADGGRSANLAPLSKILDERVFDAIECRIAVSVNLHRRPRSYFTSAG